MTIEELLPKLKFSCEPVTPGIWRCRMERKKRGMTFHHLSPTEPTLAEVLTRLAKVAAQIENTKVARTSREVAEVDEEENLIVRQKFNRRRGAYNDYESFRSWCVLYGYEQTEEKFDDYLMLRKRTGQFRYVIGPRRYTQLLGDTQWQKHVS